MERSTENSNDRYAIFKVADFRRFILGVFLFQSAFQMTEVVLGWEIYERTHSPALLGLVGLAFIIPVFLLTIPAGQIIDRNNRRNVLMIALGVACVSAVVLTISSYLRANIIFIFCGISLLGAARAFIGPCRQALLPSLLPKENLTLGITWTTNILQASMTLGPVVGGLLVALFHSYSLVYTFLFLHCVGFITLLTRMDPLAHIKSANARMVGTSREGVLSGIRFVLNTKLLVSALSLDMFAVLLGGATSLLPVYAKDILNIGPDGLGWLRAAPAAGAIIGGLILAHLPEENSPLQRCAGKLLLLCVAGFGFATIGFGLSRNVFLSFLMLLLSGAFDSVSVVTRNTLVQVLTPDEMRGRVSAVNSMFIGASNELGAFESGMAAAAFGPIAAVVGGGVGTIVVVIATAWIWPELRRLRSVMSAMNEGSSIH